MAGTSAGGVLPFVRGFDLSRYDFSSGAFPPAVSQMCGLRWLKLNRTGVERVPDELAALADLEHVQMARAALTNLHGELSDMPRLRSVIVRHNQIKTSGIPNDIFDMRDLTIVDFGHNALNQVPTRLDHAHGVIILNLSHNNIESLPNQVFVNLVDLIYLDLSHNKLSSLPPQIRRLTGLQVLNLSDNPLAAFQLKQLPSMAALRVLKMRRTQRTDDNLPPTMDGLVHLEEVDFAENQLAGVPQALFELTNLRSLNLSDNKLTAIKPLVPLPDDKANCFWEKLEVLNVSRNQLIALPEAITKMQKLKMLLANNNKIDFDGIPAGVGKLLQLEVLQLAYNNLELIPEGIGRCVKLRKLKLNNNRLITFPEGIHLLPDLKELDVRNNVDLVMPPKPAEMKQRHQFYNIDFSLEHQMKLAGQSPASSISSSPSYSTPKDPVARKLQFLKRRRGHAEADSDQRKILKGMSDVAKERERAEAAMAEERERRAKKWDQALAKPALDYGDLFDPDVGHIPGVTVWEIENFLPVMIDEAFHGSFYEGDCYIVLETFRSGAPTGPGLGAAACVDWRIYYWIGEKCTLDKKACAAIHAVNLRNHLGATCRTVREEMGDESDEFIGLFGEEIVYIEGGRTASGFFTVEPVVKQFISQTTYQRRLYRVMENVKHAKQIYVEAVALTTESLDPRFVFILDCGLEMYVWCGRKTTSVNRSKARLFAEKMNRNERKGKAEIEMVYQNIEPAAFWLALAGTECRPPEPVVEHVPADFQPDRPKLFELRMGMGYLELPQVELWNGVLRQDMLHTRHVYILDCAGDVHLWIGRQSTRLARAAGHKLAKDLFDMIDRPEHAATSVQTEGTEGMVFKCKFARWDDVIAVDYTRTADSVQRRGVDMKIIMEKDKMKTDLSALFLDRQQVMSDEEAEQLMDECNEDLELMEPFVLEGRKFVRLPAHEFGTFYMCDCYVFLCRYWVPPVEDDEESEKKDDTIAEEDEEKASSCGASSERTAPVVEPKQDDFQCVVYFWQGRDASNMGWLTFTFSLQKKFEQLFKDKLEVVRMHQQQENHKFLSHFKKKFLVRRGRRNLNMFSASCQPTFGGWPELYHVRANGSAICTRTIQVDTDSRQLQSAFCFVFRAPFKVPDDEGERGRVFVWAGGLSKPADRLVARAVCDELLNKEKFPVEEVSEGEEPELFWQMLGGRRPYDTSIDFMRYARLFRCTNERGYFAVSEKTIDFCQDDLDDDDVMILDNGDQVYLWLGLRASEVETKLAYKAATVYVQHMRLKQADRPRRLMCTLRGREPRRFTKCFHAWSKHRKPPGE